MGLEDAMKKVGLLFFSLFICLIFGRSIQAQAPTAAWINEFHYDNNGADANEFVEIVVNEEFTNLANFTVTLYNGSASQLKLYDSETLDNFLVGSTQDGFTLYYFNFTDDSRSIQNGAPDGLSIDYNGTLISGQFLSYEGTFTPTDGPAAGIPSTDIGISQSSSTPTGSSVGLTGSGTQYSDFTWINFNATATIGTTNGSQALPVELSSFSASNVDEGIKLNWRSETEVNNYGFEVERTSPFPPPYQGGGGEAGGGWEMIGFVEGHGNSNSPKEYYFIDDKVASGKYGYRLKQIDNDGTFEHSKIIEIDVDAPLEFELSQNYPNPFNPSTTIRFSLPVTSNIILSVFNILGEEVQILVNETKEAGIYTINFFAKQLNSGIYFYKLETRNFIQVKKMSLIR